MCEVGEDLPKEDLKDVSQRLWSFDLPGLIVGSLDSVGRTTVPLGVGVRTSLPVNEPTWSSWSSRCISSLPWLNLTRF